MLLLLPVIVFFSLTDATLADVSKIQSLIVTYDAPDFSGDAHEMRLRPMNCVALPHSAASLNTYGTCVTLFAGDDCTGASHKLIRRPATQEVSKIASVLFPDVDALIGSPAKFVQACAEEENRFTVDFYDDVRRAGKLVATVDVSDDQACVNLPATDDQLASFDPHETCVHLFSQLDCTGDRFTSLPSTWMEQLVMYRPAYDSGAPLTDNVRSVMKCSSVSIEIDRRSKQDAIVNLYQDEGNREHINLSMDDGCVNLDLPMLFKVSTGPACIQLFSQHNCSGPSRKIFPGSPLEHSPLSSVFFPGTEKSLALNSKSVKRCPIP